MSAPAPDVLSTLLSVVGDITNVVNDIGSAVIPEFNINLVDFIGVILTVVSDIGGIFGIDIPNFDSIVGEVCTPLTAAIAGSADCTCGKDSADLGAVSLGIRLNCTSATRVCIDAPNELFCGLPEFGGQLVLNLNEQSAATQDFFLKVPNATSCVNFEATSAGANDPFCISVPVTASITGGDFAAPTIALEGDAAVTTLGGTACSPTVLPCKDSVPLSIDIDCSNVQTTGTAPINGPNPACLDLVSFAPARRALSQQLHLDQLLDSSPN